jgi:hypothetical protein
MIISEKRLAANRANAKKSTGPKSAIARRNSSRNALKHGFLSKAILIDGESQKRFQALLDALCIEFQAETETEIGLVEIMASSRWQLLRMWTMNSANLNHEIRRQADATAGESLPTRAMLAMRALSGSGQPDSMHHIEYRLCRQHRNALRDLLLLKEKKTALTDAEKTPVTKDAI